MQIIDFQLLRIAIAIAMFSLACYFDIKKREVDDRLWLAFGSAAVILFIANLPTESETGIFMLVSILLTAAVAYGIYHFGLFGGADALCLITLAGILPLFDGNFLGNRVFLIHEFAPLVVLTNAVILLPGLLGFNILRNLVRYMQKSHDLFDGFGHEPYSKKLVAIVIGYRSDDPRFTFPLEKIVDGKKYFDFTFRNAETAAFEVRKNVWVTTAVPFLLLITAGFLAMLIGGDLLSSMIRALV